jgi:hypothetical protein
MGLMSEGDAPDEMATEEQGSGMAELLAKLSPDQKQELMGLLAQDQDAGGETPATQVEKGAPTSDEKSKIGGKIAVDEAADAEGDDESDDIQMGMLDQRSKNASADAQPRNLGERARMAAAQKLKAKGKL